MAGVPRTTDLGQRIAALEARSNVLEKASGLNSASIGSGGLTVRGGGTVTVLGGGGINVRAPGSITWTHSNGTTGLYWGTLVPDHIYSHGMLWQDNTGAARAFLVEKFDGSYDAVFGTNARPLNEFWVKSDYIQVDSSGPINSHAEGQVALKAGGNMFLEAANQMSIGLTSGDVFLGDCGTTGAQPNVYMSPEGAVYRSTWTGVTAPSSRRYKQDIEPVPYGPDLVDQLQPVMWRYRSEVEAGGWVHPQDPGNTPQNRPPTPAGQEPAEWPDPIKPTVHPPRTYAGFIAEDLHDLGLTEFVEYDLEGRPDRIAHDRLIAVLIPAIQDLRARVVSLEARQEMKP